MKKITINGHEFDFRFVKRLRKFKNEDGSSFEVDGYCEHAESSKYPKIRVREGLPEKYELDVVLHEILHAGAQHLHEDRVNEISMRMAEALWELGWRKT